MKSPFAIAVLIVAVSLAGCSEKKSETKKEPEAPAASAPAKPAETAKEDLAKVAEKACLAAVAKETNEKDVAVVSSEFSEANTLVMIGVGAKRAPWKCLAGKGGSVAEVSFTGDDSAGVSDDAKPSGDANDNVATKACLAAVAKETGQSDVAVLSSEFSQANSQVMVGVGPDRAPWKCLVSSDGVVAEVSSATDEGKL